MTYVKQTWANGPDGGTPISADRLNHMEDGIADQSIPAGDPGQIVVVQADGSLAPEGLTETVLTDASQIPFTHAGFTATDVDGALAELAEEGFAPSELPVGLVVTDDDLFIVTNDPGGAAPETRQIAASVLRTYIEGLLGSSVNIQTFTESGTWTKPTGTHQTVEAFLIGSGGGGGSGRRGAAGSIRCGGGGGGSGAYTSVVFDIDELPATVPVQVAAGAAGGAAVTTDDTNGNAGANGTDTLFGTGSAGDLYAKAERGLGGAGGTATTGTGGGAGTGILFGGAGAAASTTGTTGATSAAAAMTTGGGAGGGITSADSAFAGGTGRAPSYRANITAAPGGAAPGGAGTVGRIGTGVANSPVGGSGGGGGAGSTTTAAGAGGAGATGGGGGGGGASLNGFASGAGGNGGPGLAVIITR